MLVNYVKEEMRPIRIILKNDRVVEGEFIDIRVEKDSLPDGKTWLQLRHKDEDEMDIGSIKNGCVAVNFFGTVVCNPVPFLCQNQEISVIDWTFTD